MLFRNYSNNENSKILIKDAYIRIGTFFEHQNILCLHVRKRQDMREFYLWIYKNRFQTEKEIQNFFSHLNKINKCPSIKIDHYGLDREKIPYVAIEKNNTSLLSNIVYNKTALENIIIQAIEIVAEINAKGIYHGALSSSSFVIDTNKKLELAETFGLNFTKHIYKTANIEPGFAALGPKSDVYSLGSLIYSLCTDEVLPIFQNNEENINFLKNSLSKKLGSRAPTWIEPILKKSLCFDSEQRFKSTKEILKLASTKQIVKNDNSPESSAREELGDSILSSKINEMADLEITSSRALLVKLKPSKKLINYSLLVALLPALFLLVSLTKRINNLESDIKLVDSELASKRLRHDILRNTSNIDIKINTNRIEPKLNNAKADLNKNSQTVNEYLRPEDIQIRTKPLESKNSTTEKIISNQASSEKKLKPAVTRVRQEFLLLWNFLQAKESKICRNLLS